MIDSDDIKTAAKVQILLYEQRLYMLEKVENVLEKNYIR